jgi:hypothetical protein
MVMWTEKEERQINRAIEYAATRIEAELEKMLEKLPESAAPQMAMEVLAQLLVESTPELMGWFMTGEQSRETQARLPLARLLEERRTIKRTSD